MSNSAQLQEEAFRRVLAHRTMLKAYVQAIVRDPFESTGKAFVSLYWQSESQPREIVPQSQLFPPEKPRE